MSFLTRAGSAPMYIVTCKGLFMALVLGLYALVRAKGPGRMLDGFWCGPTYILVGSVSIAFAILLVPLAFALTSSARALLFLSLKSLWAALLGRVLLKETLPWRTVAALVLAVCSGAILFVPSIVQALQGGKRPSTSLWGDCAALAAGWAFASFLLAVRFAARYVPETQMPIALSLGSGLAAAMAAAIAGWGGMLPGLGGFGPVHHSWSYWLMAAADAGCLSACFIAMSIAPAYISAAEAGLIFLGVVVLGPLIMWMTYGEIPTWWTLLGGSVLLLTLAGHEVAGMLDRRPVNDTGSGGGEIEGCGKGSTDGSRP